MYILTHPDSDSVVRRYFQVRQRRGTLRHSVQLIYGRPQPSSVHVSHRIKGQEKTLILKDTVSIEEV